MNNKPIYYRVILSFLLFCCFFNKNISALSPADAALSRQFGYGLVVGNKLAVGSIAAGAYLTKSAINKISKTIQIRKIKKIARESKKDLDKQHTDKLLVDIDKQITSIKKSNRYTPIKANRLIDKLQKSKERVLEKRTQKTVQTNIPKDLKPA